MPDSTLLFQSNLPRPDICTFDSLLYSFYHLTMSAIAKKDWAKVGELYSSGLPMRAVAKELGVSIDAVTYVLRQLEMPRRDFRLASRLAYEAKTPTFSVRANSATRVSELDAIGAMLYWAEGYKRETASGIDFANSDPDMSKLFLTFLQERYLLDENRLHFSIYYYADQNFENILGFWSQKLERPMRQFKNHYRKSNPRLDTRKLPYGVLHVRYNDKKLLRDVLSLIESYRRKYELR